MLITIHGLPPNMRYTDVKALLKNKCGLINVILDNLVSEGNTKQVTVGVADEGDAAILVRKINGLFLNGCQLYVEDVRKKQPSDQPYRSSTYQQPARKPTPEPEFRNDGVQQQMMMTQMMNQATMARMYAAQTCQMATPQVQVAPYAAQPVQAYYVPVQPASYGASYDMGDQSYGLGNQSYDRGNQSYDRNNQGYDLDNQTDRANSKQSYDRGNVNKSFDRGSGNQSYDRGNPNQSYRGNPGQSNDRPSFDRGHATQSNDRLSLGRASFDRGNNGPSFDRDAPKSVDRGNPGQSFDRGNRGSGNQSYDRGNPQSFNRGPSGQSADRGNDRPSIDRGNSGQSFNRDLDADRANFAQKFERGNAGPDFDRRNAGQSHDRGDVQGSQAYERGEPGYARSNQSLERGKQAYDRGDQGYDRNLAYDRGNQNVIDRPGNASFDRSNPTYDNQVGDRPSDTRYRRSPSPRSRQAARPYEEPAPQSHWDQKRKRSPSPRNFDPDRNGKRFQGEQRHADRPPPYGEPSTGRNYPENQSFRRDPGYNQGRPSNPPYATQAAQRPGQAPRGPPQNAQFPGRNAPRQTTPKQEPYVPRQRAPNPRQNAPFSSKQNAPNPRHGVPFSKKNAGQAASFVPKQNAPPQKAKPTPEPNVPFVKNERRLPPIPNPNQPPPSQDKIDRWCKWGALLTIKDIRRKIQLRAFTPTETKIIQQQLSKAFMVVCKKQWPPSKWWLMNAYKSYYGTPGSYSNFIYTTLGKIEKGIFVLEHEQPRPKKVKANKKAKLKPPVHSSLNDPFQDMAFDEDPDFSTPIKKAKPIKKVEPKNSPKIPVLEEPTEERLPRFPNANKQVHKEMKKLLVREMEGEELYHLPPDKKAALKEEIDKIAEIASAECADPPDELESKVCEYLVQEAIPEFDKSLNLSITKRILNVCTGLSFRIFFEPKPPNKDILHAFLKQYGVIAARKSDMKKFWIADVKSYEAYDKLCRISSVTLDGCTLKFKPLNVSGPSDKVVRKAKNAMMRDQQKQAKYLKNQQSNKQQLKNKKVVNNQPIAGTSKVKTENVKSTNVKTENVKSANVKTENVKIENVKTEIVKSTANVKTEITSNDKTDNSQKAQIQNAGFTEDNFELGNMSNKNIDDFVLVDECNDEDEIPDAPKAADDLDVALDQLDEALDELEDFNLDVNEEDLEDYEL